MDDDQLFSALDDRPNVLGEAGVDGLIDGGTPTDLDHEHRSDIHLSRRRDEVPSLRNGAPAVGSRAVNPRGRRRR